MTLTDSEWKDWAWIKRQGRARPAFWVSALLWLVSGLLPLVPVSFTKGANHRYALGRFPLLLLDYFDPVGGLAWVVPHVALSAFLGLVLWRTIERVARWGRRVNRPG